MENNKITKIYEKLDHQIRLLHLRWYWLRSLYASELRLELLNNSEPTFFRIVQDLLFENIELMICKITEHSKKDQRLCLRTLLNHIKPVDNNLFHELSILESEISSKTKDLTIRRNNANAHLNLEIFINEKIDELPKSTVADYEFILESLRNLMRRVSIRFDYTEFYYEGFKNPDNRLFMNFIKSQRYND